MISREGINYSLRNIMSSKSRSFLTIFSIMVGITTLFIFISFGLGLYEYVDELMEGSSANKLMIQPKGNGAGVGASTFKLTKDDIKAIESVAGVDKVTGSFMGPAKISQDSQIKYVFIAGYDPKLPLLLEVGDVDIEKGRWLRPSDKRKVMLGYNYQKENTILPKPYDVGDKIEIDGMDHRVVGFMSAIGSPQDDSSIYITNDYFEELYNDTDSYSFIIVESNVDNLEPVIEKIEDKLRKLRGQDEGKEDFHVQSFEDLIESFSGALNIVIGFIVFIALVSVLVSTVNTANTMVTSVLERFKEIGILKAVGARNSEIFSIFLFESSFLGFIAGITGVFFGWLFAYSAGALLEYINYGFLTPSYSPYLIVGCIIFATITGGVSGVFPARYASKTNTVDALRYE